MTTALTIAGSDSGGGAGIQADLKTFAALGVYGTSAITALTAQNTLGVRAVALTDVAMVAAQIDAVMDDIGADAVKTGMLGSAEIIAAVVAAIDRHHIHRLVVDPVMVAKSGDRLLEPAAVVALRDYLLPRALVLTPNLPEAEVLLQRPVRNRADMLPAARDLLEFGPRAVVLKGGHLPDDEVVDLLVDASGMTELRAQRVHTRHTHGTGCTFAAAIAAHIARGATIANAVAGAHTYLQGAIRAATPLGGGHGPVNHFHQFGVGGMPGDLGLGTT